MKILVLAPQPFFQNRGTPIAVRLLVETLASHAHDIHLLVFHEGDNIVYNNLTIHRTPSFSLLEPITPGFSLKKIGSDLLMFFKCMQILRKNKFDFVHAVEESVFTAMISRLIFKVPYVYDLDSLLSDQLVAKLTFLKPLRGFFEKIEGLAVRHSAGVVPVCLAIEDKIKHVSNGKPLVRLEDISLLEPAATGQAECLKELINRSGKIILYVGNLEQYQGIDLLIETFSLINTETHDCNLVCIGGIPEDIARYTSRAQQLGIDERVFFVGPRPIADLGHYLGQADVLVSPRTEGENTPMKIYSYMDSGRPILATSILSHTQVLDQSNAFLADPDPASMAAELVKALSDPNEARLRGDQAKQKVATHYSRAAYEKKLTNFYETLASTQHKANQA